MATVSLGDAVTLLASTTVTATSAGSTPVFFGTSRPPTAYVFVLDVTDADSDSGDTLNVYVQTLMGSNWVDVVAFTQVAGDGSDTQRHFGKIAHETATTMFENATALTAGNVRNLVGSQWRVRYVVADTGSNQNFVFSVYMVPM